MPNALLDLRLTLQANGYSPVPCQGKRPTLPGWQKMPQASAAEMARWAGPNTGLLTANLATFDLDILSEDIAGAAERIIQEWFDGRGKLLVRFGNAPKRAIPVRATVPFPKTQSSLVDAHGRAYKIEILCEGQQVVAFGQHPDTGKNYAWAGGYDPANTPRSELPELAEAEAHALLRFLTQALCAEFALTRSETGRGNGHANVQQPGVPRVPVDVEARLAAMEYQGADGSGINATLCSVIPALLRRAEDPDEVLQRCVAAVLEAGARAGQSWNERQERSRVGCSITSAYRLFMAEDGWQPEHGIPSWLPGKFHDRWHRALTEGERPKIVRNPQGFQCRTFSNNHREAPRGKPREAPRHEPGDSPQSDSPGRGFRFRLMSFADLRPGPEPLYLVDELIPAAGLVDVWGKAKCFKSFWVLDLMLHVALGWEYRDRYVRQAPVVYCAFEGAHGYKKRIEALRRHYAIDDEQDVPLFIMPGQANLIVEHRVLINDITAQLGETIPGAVVLDTLNKSLFGSENKDVDMGNYVRAAEAIRDAFGCVVIIVHHCGYDDTRPRGHSSLPGAVDAQLAVTRQEEVITVTVEMMRDGPEDTQVVSTVQTVDVGQDQNGKTLTSLVVLPSDANPANAHKGWPRGLSVFHTALKDALAQRGEAFQPEVGVVPVRAVNQWFVRDRFYATYADASADDEADATKRQSKLRQAFGRALADAQGRGLVKIRRMEDGATLVWFPERGA